MRSADIHLTSGALHRKCTALWLPRSGRAFMNMRRANLVGISSPNLSPCANGWLRVAAGGYSWGSGAPASSDPSHSSQDFPTPGGPHTSMCCAGSPSKCRCVFAASASCTSRWPLSTRNLDTSGSVLSSSAPLFHLVHELTKPVNSTQVGAHFTR